MSGCFPVRRETDANAKPAERMPFPETGCTVGGGPLNRRKRLTSPGSSLLAYADVPSVSAREGAEQTMEPSVHTASESCRRPRRFRISLRSRRSREEVSRALVEAAALPAVCSSAHGAARDVVAPTGVNRTRENPNGRTDRAPLRRLFIGSKHDPKRAAAEWAQHQHDLMRAAIEWAQRHIVAFAT